MRIAMRKIIAFILTICMMTGIMSVTENRQVQAATLRLSQKSATLIAGDSLRLYVTGSKAKVTWSTSDKKVATVSAKGIVSAKKDGNVKITAAVGKKKLSCSIVVIDNMGENLMRVANQMAMCFQVYKKPETAKIEAISYGDYEGTRESIHNDSGKWLIGLSVEDENGKRVSDDWTWKEDGSWGVEIRGNNTGTSKEYSSEEVEQFDRIVKLFYKHPYDFESDFGRIHVSKEELTLMKGENKKLSLANTDAKVVWKSSNKSIATVSKDGKVKAVKAGEAVITATAGGKNYKCKLHILPKLTDAELVALFVVTNDKMEFYYPESCKLVSVEIGNFQDEKMSGESEKYVDILHKFSIKIGVRIKNGYGHEGTTYAAFGQRENKVWSGQFSYHIVDDFYKGTTTETCGEKKIKELQKIIDSNVMLYYDESRFYGTN